MTTHKYILSREKLYQIAALQRIFTSIHDSRERIKKQSDIIRFFYAEVNNYIGFALLFYFFAPTSYNR